MPWDEVRILMQHRRGPDPWLPRNHLRTRDRFDPKVCKDKLGKVRTNNSHFLSLQGRKVEEEVGEREGSAGRRRAVTWGLPPFGRHVGKHPRHGAVKQIYGRRRSEGDLGGKEVSV